MIKKTLIIIFTIIYLLLISMEVIQLANKNKEIERLDKEINSNYNTELNRTYTRLYAELKKEVGTITDDEDITNKISLLEKTSNQNIKQLNELEKEVKTNKETNANIEYVISSKELALKKNTVILNKTITYNQFPNYPTGCESVALYILLKYYDIDVSVSDIVAKLKKGSLPYNVSDVIYGGNPEIEFIGDPTNNYSYGVYNKPMADVAKIFKSNVITKTGVSLEETLNLVKGKRPVMVWATINMVVPQKRRSWIYEPTGEKITWISGEHALVIIGYDDENVIVSDPYTGTIRYFDKKVFKERFDYLGGRILYYEK